MQIRESHNNGDIVSIVNTINNTITTPITATVTSTSTFTHTKLEKYEKKIISHDSGYLIPLNVDQNIKKLSEEKNINTNHYFKIDNDHCYNNCFLYQLVNNEPYVLNSVTKNYFITLSKKILYNHIHDQLKHISDNFKDTIKKVNENKGNQRNNYSIYGGCLMMQ